MRSNTQAVSVNTILVYGVIAVLALLVLAGLRTAMDFQNPLELRDSAELETGYEQFPAPRLIYTVVCDGDTVLEITMSAISIDRTIDDAACSGVNSLVVASDGIYRLTGDVVVSNRPLTDAEVLARR